MARKDFESRVEENRERIGRRLTQGWGPAVSLTVLLIMGGSLLYAIAEAL